MSQEFHIDYKPICEEYSKSDLQGTLYLAFRDVPQLIHDHLLSAETSKIKALDFGCGTGVSTRYLKSLRRFFPHGIEVHGVDISREMLKFAIHDDPTGLYLESLNDKIPAENETYDLVFSSFVLFEFATKAKMKAAIQEIIRIMKHGALFIAVTGSADSYVRCNDWVSLNVNFSQNDQLKSGELGRVDFLLGKETITFQNYYWKEEDYLDVFEQAGLRWTKTHRPLGNFEEEKKLSWKWKSEVVVSPYYVFVLSRP